MMSENLIYLFTDVSRNRLAKIPELAFSNLHNLTWLDLSYNKLAVIEVECLQPLVNLHVLNISGNIQIDLDLARTSFQVCYDLCIYFKHYYWCCSIYTMYHLMQQYHHHQFQL